MKALVIGGDGMLGSALVADLKNKGHDVSATSRLHKDASNYLDLYQPRHYDFPHGVNVVYLVAAITKVVDCEADPQKTWQVNADAPVELCRAAMEGWSDQTGAYFSPHVIFISSDAVERAPNLNYSKQKAYAEQYVLARGGAVVRPSRIPQFKVHELATFLINLGLDREPGMFRWNP